MKTKLRFVLMAAVLANSALFSNVSIAQQGPQPGICTRACWGARNGTCTTGLSALSRAIIHHTAGSGDWTTDFEAAKSKVRGTQNYHMDVNGWCDVGYHFLLSAGGHIFEARKNSMAGLPRGAHDACNANSFGFTMLGYYHPPYNQGLTGAGRGALESVIAWRMPGSWSPFGSGTYCSKSVGTLDGHYKVVATACPGDVIIPQIPGIRNGVSAAKSGCNINLTGGAIRAKYESVGGCGSFLGAPTTGELGTPDGVGRYNHFQNGSIYWTPNFGAWSITGSIRGKWSDLGWEQGFLGYPVSDENPTPDGVGRFNHFKRLSDGMEGSIYWTPNFGAWSITGGIRAKWAALGWENGLGYPITDETPTPDGIGSYNHFQRLSGGNASIYWSPGTGAWSVQNAIRDKWAALGWENSCHGYPVSDEYDWNGGRRTDFQNGYIHWTPAGGAWSSCEAPPPPPPTDVTVDNADAGFAVVGAGWSTGTGATDKFGANYRFRSTAAVSEPASWTVNLANAGTYNVYAWWAQGANRSATAPYIVYHSTGSTTINKNQQANGGSWQSLGAFSLNAGSNQVRLSCWTTTGFVVLADAVRWQQQ